MCVSSVLPCFLSYYKHYEIIPGYRRWNAASICSRWLKNQALPILFTKALVHIPKTIPGLSTTSQVFLECNLCTRPQCIHSTITLCVGMTCFSSPDILSSSINQWHAHTGQLCCWWEVIVVTSHMIIIILLNSTFLIRKLKCVTPYLDFCVLVILCWYYNYYDYANCFKKTKIYESLVWILSSHH